MRIEYPEPPKGASHAVALAVADIHLSERAPRARAEVGDHWLSLQASYFDQLNVICCNYRYLAKNDRVRPPTLLVAGDVFDSAHVSPRLMNWSIRQFQRLPGPPLAVIGNHELPYHNPAFKSDSPLTTLAHAKAVNLLDGGKFTSPDAEFYGFDYGDTPRRPVGSRLHGDVHVAVIHDYCWYKGHTFPHAPKDKYATRHLENFKGYDVLVFGDNHNPFTLEETVGKGTRRVLNCGCMVRRTVNEVGYRPGVGVVWDTGELGRVEFDTSHDRWVEADELKEMDRVEEAVEAAVAGLRGIRKARPVLFKQLLTDAMTRIGADRDLRAEVLAALEGGEA